MKTLILSQIYQIFYGKCEIFIFCIDLPIKLYSLRDAMGFLTQKRFSSIEDANGFKTAEGALKVASEAYDSGFKVWHAIDANKSMNEDAFNAVATAITGITGEPKTGKALFEAKTAAQKALEDAGAKAGWTVLLAGGVFAAVGAAVYAIFAATVICAEVSAFAFLAGSMGTTVLIGLAVTLVFCLAGGLLQGFVLNPEVVEAPKTEDGGKGTPPQDGGNGNTK
jgi:hypothetical protein